MKKIALLASLALAVSLPGVAQIAGPSGRPGTPGTPGGTDTPGATFPSSTSHKSRPSGTNDQMQNETQTSEALKSDQKMGKKMTVTGCISEKGGKYMLMNSQHPDGIVLMTSENLKPHVGHTVTVIGMMESGSSSNGGANMGESSRSDAIVNAIMKMTSMKMVSDSCNSSVDKSTK